jgi:hypothetical protein
MIRSIAYAVALALMADRALAAEPQMPEDFQGTWCSTVGFPGESTNHPGPCEDLNCRSHPAEEWCNRIAAGWINTEITATKVSSPAVSCVVRRVTKFDVCPWGMIFRNRKRARALRSFQINPWGPGYHIVLQCTSAPKQSETIGNDWYMEKGALLVGDVTREYRCPWDRRGAR